MLTCKMNDGIYEGAIVVMNKEIEGRNVEEIVQMGITLVKIDIIINEIQVVRIETPDVAQMYKILENNEGGNIMRNGNAWRGRAIKTIKTIFMEIMQASNITETYDNHKKILEDFIKMNAKNERLEHVGIGWAESNEKCVRVHVKMTKRDCNHIKQRIEIFQTKTKILKSCENSTHLGKPKFIEKFDFKNFYSLRTYKLV